jgi:hypothetical protein
MKPRAQRIPHPERLRPSDQNEESSLERIMRVVRVDQHTATDALNHRSMALNQGSERLFSGVAAIGREPLQELAVSQILQHTRAEKRV